MSAAEMPEVKMTTAETPEMKMTKVETPAVKIATPETSKKRLLEKSGHMTNFALFIPTDKYNEYPAWWFIKVWKSNASGKKKKKKKKKKKEVFSLKIEDISHLLIMKIKPLNCLLDYMKFKRWFYKNYPTKTNSLIFPLNYFDIFFVN